MLLKSIKSQPKISYLESIARASDTQSTASEANSVFPHWNRSRAKFDQLKGFGDNEYAR